MFDAMKHGLVGVVMLGLAAGVAASCSSDPPCGGEGETCCANAACNAGFTCNAATAGTCEVSCTPSTCPVAGDAGTPTSDDSGPGTDATTPAEASADSGPDTSVDSASEASDDAGPDADASVDSPSDTSAD